MKFIANRQIIRDDRLVLVISDGQRIFRQGKRVGRTSRLSPSERRAYVENGSIAAVKEIMKRPGYTLTAAWNLLKAERGDKL